MLLSRFVATGLQIQGLVKKHPTDRKKAICTFCQKKEINLSNMGISALVSHTNSNGHSKVVQDTSPRAHIFFTSPSKSASSKQPPQETKQSSSAANAIDLTESAPSTSQKRDEENADENAAAMPSDAEVALNAEIRWALKCVTAHYSYRSNIDNRLLFQAMAPGYKPFQGCHLTMKTMN